jgi:regulator of sigma D
MLENCQSAKERWGGVNNIIDRWLHERQQLLVDYCNLSGIQSFDEDSIKHQEQVKRLCQIWWIMPPQAILKYTTN